MERDEHTRRRSSDPRRQGTERRPSAEARRKREQEEERRKQEEERRRKAEAAKRKKRREAARKREEQARREEEARKKKRAKQKRQAEAAKENEQHRTPARALPRRNLMLKLATTLAVVAALTLGLTIFFKVQNIRVSGNERYVAEEIIKASGIEYGENLLTLGESRAAGKILADLPYVGDVQIGIKLPNTVHIDIVELTPRYVIQSEDGTWWFMDGSGKLLEPTGEASLTDYTKVEGVTLSRPRANEQAAAKEPEDQEDAALVGTARERLNAAVEILSTLQEEDRKAQVTSVNVTELYDIRVAYAEQYQVILGGPLDLTYKTRYMVRAVERLSEGEYRSGVLDLTFSEPGKAVFTPW